MEFDKALKRIALPLRADVIAIELQAAYANAYAQTLTAWHIQHEGRYTESDLPFPSTLNDKQHPSITQKITAWQTEL
jgi:hypothetical protein